MIDQVEDAPSETGDIKCKKAPHEQGSATLGVVAAPGLLRVFSLGMETSLTLSSIPRLF